MGRSPVGDSVRRAGGAGCQVVLSGVNLLLASASQPHLCLQMPRLCNQPQAAYIWTPDLCVFLYTSIMSSEKEHESIWLLLWQCFKVAYDFMCSDEYFQYMCIF